MLEYWDLWFPQAGATGLAFARSRVEAADAAGPVLVHAAPPQLDVVVRDGSGAVLAEGYGLRRTAPGPMSVLLRTGREIALVDRWPAEADLGRLVLLPGGEAGKLVRWWHAEDHSEWTWQVEFHNHT